MQKTLSELVIRWEFSHHAQQLSDLHITAASHCSSSRCWYFWAVIVSVFVE